VDTRQQNAFYFPITADFFRCHHTAGLDLIVANSVGSCHTKSKAFSASMKTDIFKRLLYKATGRIKIMIFLSIVICID